MHPVARLNHPRTGADTYRKHHKTPATNRQKPRSFFTHSIGLMMAYALKSRYIGLIRYADPDEKETRLQDATRLTRAPLVTQHISTPLGPRSSLLTKLRALKPATMQCLQSVVPGRYCPRRHGTPRNSLSWNKCTKSRLEEPCFADDKADSASFQKEAG